MSRYAIKIRKSGNVKGIHDCIGRARLELSQFEEFDKQQGNYTPDFYEIAEETESAINPPSEVSDEKR